MAQVQPHLARVRRVGVGEAKRAADDLFDVADRAHEPVPGLTAANRAAHRIAPGPGRDGVLAPRAQSGHARAPVPRIAADSNGDSNSSDRRQRITLARSAPTWICPA